jgi:hypothetical protein
MFSDIEPGFLSGTGMTACAKSYAILLLMERQGLGM